MGFGDLKVLRNLITELAIENGQSVENGRAVKGFISDVESHYIDYLRWGDKVSQSKSVEPPFFFFFFASASSVTIADETRSTAIAATAMAAKT
jgi:hypothetical protein